MKRTDYLKTKGLQSIMVNPLHLKFTITKLHCNENGEIVTLHSAHLEFNRQNREDYWMANDLKNLICDHLNLNPNEVVLYTNSPEETVFKVRLIPEQSRTSRYRRY